MGDRLQKKTDRIRNLQDNKIVPIKRSQAERGARCIKFVRALKESLMDQRGALSSHSPRYHSLTDSILDLERVLKDET